MCSLKQVYAIMVVCGTITCLILFFSIGGHSVAPSKQFSTMPKYRQSLFPREEETKLNSSTSPALASSQPTGRKKNKILVNKKLLYIKSTQREKAKEKHKINDDFMDSFTFVKKPHRSLSNISMGDFEGVKLFLRDWTSSDICGSPRSPFILAIVPSSVENELERNVIRGTWGNKRLFLHTGIRTVFVVGATDKLDVQRRVEQEGTALRDIIQMSCVDSYRNLTFKTMTALLWVSDNCKEVPWVLKVDDDVVVNPFNLRSFLEAELEADPSPSYIMGRLRPSSKPFRSGKWKVTVVEYPFRVYPRFILGSAYIVGGSAIEKLIEAARKTSFLYLEDVFFTGLVSRNANVGLKNIESTKFATMASQALISGNKIFLVGASKKVRKHIWNKIILAKPSLT